MKEKTGDEIKKRPKQQNHEKSERTSKGLGSYPEDCELYCTCDDSPFNDMKGNWPSFFI